MAGFKTCKVTRTNKARRIVAGIPLGGRPLGYLMAWLQLGQHVPDKASHWNKTLLTERLTVAERQRCRDELALLERGQLLLAVERQIAEGEPAEACSLEGLLL
eukprot:2198362-Amphidinium_carterae.3